MRIRSITLSEVRQFARPVSISGFDAGLNVLAAPNEAGKSTLFDAIHALLFIPHRSAKIATLKPSVGGNPEIAMELDLTDGPHRIVKRWGRGASAEVFRGESLIARADEAEAFISRITTPAEEGGPAGLLWVRQGTVALDHGSKKEADAAQIARRDLMSSVTGEFDGLTGGRRMDRALARAREDLDRLVTQRGPKAGGPLDRMAKLVASLATQRDQFADKAAQLRDALTRRRSVLINLAQIADPEAANGRARRLADATEAHGRATLHAEKLTAARAALENATLRQDKANAALRRLTEAEAAVEATDRLLAQANEAGIQGRTTHAASVTELAGCRQTTNNARAALAGVEARLQTALRAQTLHAQGKRHAELTARLAEAQKLSVELVAVRQAAQVRPDRPALAALEKAAQELAFLERLAESAAPHLRLDYLPGVAARAEAEGAVIEDGVTHPVLRPMQVGLPGLGALHLTPGATVADQTKLDDARATFERRLAESGCPNLEAARIAAEAHQQAAEALVMLDARLRGLAPEGIESMKAELATISPAGRDTGAPDPAEAEAAVTAARATLDAALRAEDSASQIEGDARDKALRAEVAAEAAATQQRAAADALAGFGAAERARTDLQAAQVDAIEVHRAAEAAHASIARDAPDLAACQAHLARARSVIASAETEERQLLEERARLETQIDIHAGNGVEEELADTEAQLVRARADLAAQEQEVAVLRTLIAALEEAQSAARDRYFAPVLSELRPMLRLLWPDAELQFDGESLLPTALIRNGLPEEIGTLSGGTREQIALLVRLAFARLLARSGRHAPVILDDALVYSDDDRIERMFDALHQQAADLQIIVLSCRNRAFRELGGQKLSFQPLTSEA